MTRSDILKRYKLDEEGRIQNPGKFEGEKLYVPYFWEAFMDGLVDDFEEDVMVFHVDDADVVEFPELGVARIVKLVENELGLVVEVNL